MEGSIGLRRGAWCREEDDLLKACVELYGERNWHLVPIRAGLNRCRKSCRLRWLNYLKPNIKRGEFSEDEVDLMIRMHRLVGNRWSLIAGRLPGRTANDVKNYWNSKVVRNKNKQSSSSSFRKEHTTTNKNNNNIIIAEQKETSTTTAVTVIKPQPRTFARTCSTLRIDDDSAAGQHHQKQESDNHDNILINIGGAKQITITVNDAAAVLEDNKGGNEDEFGSDEVEKDWNIEDLITGIGYDDLLIEGQSWSDLLLHANLWESLYEIEGEWINQSSSCIN